MFQSPNHKLFYTPKGLVNSTIRALLNNYKSKKFSLPSHVGSHIPPPLINQYGISQSPPPKIPKILIELVYHSWHG